MKILLVEDTRTVSALLSAKLHKFGHEVVLANNGQVAVNLFIETSPDLVLMDINMPVLNGFEATNQIRSFESLYKLAWTPILFLTASDTPDNLVTAINAGADDFLSKSVPEPVLHAKIMAMARIAEKNRQLQISQTKYQNLFGHMSNGFALHEMIFDDHGMPIDYRFLEVNPAFEKMTGLSRENLIGRTVLEMMPETEDYWIKNYGEVVLTGEPRKIENYARQIGRWYRVEAYRPEAGKFAVLMEDITELKIAHNELEHFAHYDVLTDLPNRALFADRLNQELASAKRRNSFLAVGYMDLDKFKPVNDNFGHEVGDYLLKEVSQRLKGTLRTNDSVSRLGGDEFAILLSDFKTQIELGNLLNRTLQTIANPYQIKGHAINISMSLGVTIFPTDNADPDTLLRHADDALYTAKQAGRNRFAFFDANKLATLN
jgi:diguanylate cyclase (GGDEF)-like protein/PAS domain S-box-containing protein